MGNASSKSRPLPWGTPSTTSTSTMSANSLAAIQWAAVAPTFPAPTMVTFFRIFLLTHVLNHPRGEFARLRLGGSRHLPLKIVGDVLLQDGVLERVLDQLGRLVPAQEFKHHHPREQHRTRINDVFVGILGRRAVSSFEDRIAVADIRPRSNAQAAHLRRACVRDIVAIQIRARQYAVLIRPDNDLLK